MKLPVKPKGDRDIIDDDNAFVCFANIDRDQIIKAINSHKKFKEALEKIVELETDCCPRCEGNGRLYADGKAHLISENADTIHCGNCGGSGRILPEDAQEIASEALEAEKKE